MKLFPKTKWGKLGVIFFVGVILYIFALPLNGYLRYQPKEGDIIFQSLPTGELTEVIEGATHSPYSHVGMVVEKEGKWYVREATGTVHDTGLYRWIARGRQGSFSVYRLKEEYQKNLKTMVENSKQFLGRGYDINYKMDDEKIYCSELVYKSYQLASGEQMGKLASLKELDWKPYEEFILSIEETIPLDRVMITPKDLAEAEQLEKVFSSY